MHAYIITRGIKHDSDRFITELQGKYLEWFKDKEGKSHVVGVGVRPIQLWEIVFPEQHLDLMMNTLFCDETTRKGNGLSYAKRNKKFLWAMRKILKSKQFPKLKDTSFSLPIYKSNIEIAGIGIKKDEYKDGIEQL